MIAEFTATALIAIAVKGTQIESQSSYVMKSSRSTAPVAVVVEQGPEQFAGNAGTANEPMTLEYYVRSYFSETPILAEIAKCESTFRHFDSKGRPLRGIENASDVGVMQINEYYHKATAEKLGYDIQTLEGNLEYAKWLYGRYGAAPWVHSSKCWGKFDRLAFNKIK